jgi:hypothetical protein
MLDICKKDIETSNKLTEMLTGVVKDKSETLKEVMDEVNKRLKEHEEKSEQITKRAEDAKQKEADGLLKYQKEIEKHFSGIEELLEKHKKCIFDLNSKFGIKKTSLDSDVEEKGFTDDSHGEADFNNVVRGKKKI